MGNFTSRRNTGVEEVDLVEYNAYKYPPKFGNSYFANYFYMGGEQFDTIHPEMYLFGENQDLNFLGNRPIPFPYQLSHTNEPSRTLKSLINIRKDSLRFVKVHDGEDPKNSSKKTAAKDECLYNIEFTFDSDVNCAVTIYYFATEKFTNGYLTYSSRDPSMTSSTFHYKRGANQTFSQTSHVIDPSKYAEDDWIHHPDRDVIPIVVHCVVNDENNATHSHATFGQVELNSESSYCLKPLKQKQAVDGLCYLIQEIYGIENKNNERSKMDHEDEFEDNSSECVICMCEMRDTLILPCRHLCLCSCCANNLRYQANNCPICRAPFRALLQIRALRKKGPYPAYVQNEEDIPATHDGIPQGYESVSLMEALNGPLHQLHTQSRHMAGDMLSRPGLLNSPSSSPELCKPCKIPGQLVKPHQSISDMSLQDTAISEASKDVPHCTGDKLLNPCASRLHGPDLGSTSPSDMSSCDPDMKGCSELSESDDSPDSLSGVPAVEVINEVGSCRSRPRLPTLPGSPYQRRSELRLSENDTCSSVDLSPAAPDVSFPSEPTLDEESYDSPTHSPTPDRDETDDGGVVIAMEPGVCDGTSGSSYGSNSSSRLLLQDRNADADRDGALTGHDSSEMSG